MREVLLAGLDDVEVRLILGPPRIVGAGLKRRQPENAERRSGNSHSSSSQPGG
jgi:hypothetical protein